MVRPRVFIGSSGESLEIAYTVQELLEHQAEVTVWDQGTFDLSAYTLPALLSGLESSDFGVFILAPDDVTRIRGQELATVRDNVILELGLFVGRMGLERSLMIVPDTPNRLHLPTDLLGLTTAGYNPRRDDGNIKAALGPACQSVRRHLLRVGRRAEPTESLPRPTLVPRSEFTEFLLAGLARPNTHLTMVTYTGEVDTALIDPYHTRHGTTIEVLKRSILDDLAEQQEWNMRRLAAGITARRWNKRLKSIKVSERLTHDVPAGVTVRQYLYTAPPSKRIYLFDQRELMYAAYQVLDDTSCEGGSAYRGITDSPAVRVGPEDDFGQFVLAEIRHYIASLKRVSRTWADERAILLERAPWSGTGRRPCVCPRAAFFDVDGVLLDSAARYAQAWQAAFAPHGHTITELMSYCEEGRRTPETIRRWLATFGHPRADDAFVDSLASVKRQTFARLGAPPVLTGAHELLQVVAESGLDIWVVTGSSDDLLAERLAQLFPKLVQADHVIQTKHARQGKPNPDMYLLACDRAGVHPHEGIAFENAPLGIRAADAAGLFCLAVNTHFFESQEFYRLGARAIFRSCTDLAALWPEAITILHE
jgi:beta-phosphoglucomutase-like phosphatase (HAD superfamily)